MAIRSPRDILKNELKEIYAAERQLARGLQRISRGAGSERLRQALQQRLDRGEQLMRELDGIFEDLDIGRTRMRNVAAEGLIEDCNDHMEEIRDQRLLDPVLVADVQKIEHYCIACWGSARSMGQVLGAQRVVECMDREVEEGKRFDRDLTRLAEREINPMVLEAEGEPSRGRWEMGGRERGRAHGHEERGREDYQRGGRPH
jgi:ferritin-like metal-binding protein YciE